MIAEVKDLEKAPVSRGLVFEGLFLANPVALLTPAGTIIFPAYA
jgi:hypothetical protein